MALREAGYAGAVRLIGDEREAPYERPALSKKVLTGDEAPESARIFPREDYAAKDIELVTGITAVALAPSAQQVFLSDGSAVEYEKLLITTGSRVRPLPPPAAACVRSPALPRAWKACSTCVPWPTASRWAGCWRQAGAWS